MSPLSVVTHNPLWALVTPCPQLGPTQGSLESLTSDGRSGGLILPAWGFRNPRHRWVQAPFHHITPAHSPSACLWLAPWSLGHRGVRPVVAAGITGLRGCPAGGQQRVASQWPTGYLCSSNRGPAGVHHRLGLCVSVIQLCVCAIQLCESVCVILLCVKQLCVCDMAM